MSETHTIAEVAADEELLRSLAGKVLNPGPWKHDPDWITGNECRCMKCRKEFAGVERAKEEGGDCPIPDPTVGSLADIVSELTQKMCKRRDEHRLWSLLRSREQDMLECWWGMTPSEQAACLLAVLLPERVKP